LIDDCVEIAKLEACVSWKLPQGHSGATHLFNVIWIVQLFLPMAKGKTNTTALPASRGTPGMGTGSGELQVGLAWIEAV
jgi:hypothetical protein